jgi:hypothetical protein
MKRRYWLATLPFLVLGGAAVAFIPPTVSPEAIEFSVIRKPEFLNRAWNLPMADTFGHQVMWQSNGSLCGAASIANTFRSLCEALAR